MTGQPSRAPNAAALKYSKLRLHPEPMAAGTSPPGPLRRLPLEQLLVGAALVTAALAIFWPALAGGWLWDDQNLLGLNPALRTFRGLGQIWFSPTGPDYFP